MARSTLPEVYGFDEADNLLISRRLMHRLEVVGWDGILPVVVAVGPIAIRVAFPEPHSLLVVLLVLTPLVAALIRAHIGHEQIVRRFGDRAHWLRQVAMALAIILLLIFETAVNVLAFGKNLPAAAWLLPVGCYLVYLFAISAALHGARPASNGV